MRTVIEVVTPAVSLDLTILATAKVRLGVTDNAMDTQIQTWIKQASDAIATACDRVFGQETVTETFYPRQCVEALVLSRYPVASITSVNVDGVALDEADYTISNGLLLRLSSSSISTWSAGKIAATYVGGYTLLGELPYDLERACLDLVAYYRSASSRDPLAKRVEIPDVRTVDYWVGAVGTPGELPPDVQTLIAPHRRWRV